MPNYFFLKDVPNNDRVIEGLRRLRAQLDRDIPERSIDKTMRLATWNLREFDSTSFGVRLPDAYHFIAEIMASFDLIAVQEVRRDLEALETLMRHLGRDWKYLVTDTTEGEPGNEERLAFIYDSRKVRFTGLAGELVLPEIEAEDGTMVQPKQIVRTPFTASFQSGWVKLQLATVHILYGTGAANLPARVEEIKALASFLATKSVDDGSVANNLVLLGDFNIFSPRSNTMLALTEAGWTIPAKIQELPRGSNVAGDKRYDQIAVLPRAHQFQPAGVFDFFESVYRTDDQSDYVSSYGDYDYLQWRTYQMSDHLPLWMDILIDYTDDYLDGLTPEPDQSRGQDPA